MTVSAEESRVGTTFGKHTDHRRSRQGGMGESYEAYDNEIGRLLP
jgi:serine/threonine-protein kinase